MTEFDTRILRELASANALTTREIAEAIDAATAATQHALHRPDEAGHVLLRNGFYRLSEAARMSRPGEVS